MGFDKLIINVPQSLVRTLDRAINLRSQHGQWSRDRNGSSGSSDQSKDADEGHFHFLEVLKQTREILKPRMTSEVVKDFLVKPNGDAERHETDGISNRFAELDVQEPSQASIDAPDVVPVPKEEPAPRYEAETVNSLEEQYNAAHCLFEDINRLCPRSRTSISPSVSGKVRL